METGLDLQSIKEALINCMLPCKCRTCENDIGGVCKKDEARDKA